MSNNGIHDNSACSFIQIKIALTPKLEMDSVLTVIREKLKAFSQFAKHSTKGKVLHERNKNDEANNKGCKCPNPQD